MAYRIAITDDDELNRSTAKQILEKNGYATVCYSSGEELLERIAVDPLPDLILLDIHMNGINGIQTMIQLKQLKGGASVPVIILTADDNEQMKTEAFTYGATDYVEKPFIPSILLLRVRNTIELFRLQKDLKAAVLSKTEEVLEEHKRLDRLYLQVVRSLVRTIDAKDSYTGGHSERVAGYSMEIAERAGFSKQQQYDIYMMGLLHDIGKIGVGGSIINKPSGLSDEEYDKMKKHPLIGYDILSKITDMPKLAIGARSHHERYDGTGYPDGLKGKEIPVEARIIAVADAYDAMASRRSYHDVKDSEFVINEMKKGKGTQFDPKFADIMISIIKEKEAANNSLSRHEEISNRQADIATTADPVSQPEDNVAVQADADTTPEEVLYALKSNGFIIEAALSHCMNDYSIYVNLLNEFADTYDKTMQIVRRTINSEPPKLINRKAYHNMVHSLKSNSKLLGAAKLSEIAKNLENATSDENYDSGNDSIIVEANDKLMECFLQVITVINNNVPKE